LRGYFFWERKIITDTWDYHQLVMKKCLDLSIFGYSATNHTPNQTPYSSIPDNELFMLSCKWLSFNVNCADKIEYEIPQNIAKTITAKD
jgi:hypothetical protein